MAIRAQITVNGVPGSNDDVAINVIVLLSNNGLGGETTFLWSIADQPDGLADALSSTVIQSPQFTPKKEGTYLVNLTVGDGTGNTQTNQIAVAVRQLKTRVRIPAQGETTEVSASEGWHPAVAAQLQALDNLRADPGKVVGVISGALSRGAVVRCVGVTTIKIGLPGQEVVPQFGLAVSTDPNQINKALGVLEGGIDGNTAPANGALVYVRLADRFAGAATGQTGAVGDPIFLTDAGGLSANQGTYRRMMGTVASVNADASRDVFLFGAGLDEAPQFVSEVVTTFLDLLNAATALSAANSIRVRSSGGRFQVSENGGPFVDVTPGGGGVAPAPATSVYLIVGPDASLPNARDVTNLSSPLVLKKVDPANNAPIQVLNLYALTSAGGGLGVNGVAAQLNLLPPNAAGSSVNAAQLNGILDDVTAGAEKGAFEFWTLRAGVLTLQAKIFSTGEIQCSDPTVSSHAATKNYVDPRFAAPVTFGADGSGGAPATTFLYPGYGPATATANRIEWDAPYNGILSVLRIQNRVGSGGAGETYTLQVNGVNSALTAHLAAGANSGSDTVHTVTANAGDRIAMTCVGDGGIVSGASNVTASLKMQAT